MKTKHSILALCILLFAALVAAPAFAEQSQDSEKNIPWHKVSYDGMDVYYQDWGNKDAQTLVFIHGWSCDSSVWRMQTPDFKKDYHVLVLDLPGFGKSSKPQDKVYSPQLFAGAVKAVVDQSKAKDPVLIGHSMGYAIIRQFLADYPGAAKAIINVDGFFLQPPSGPEQQANWEKDLQEFAASFEGPEREATVSSLIKKIFYGKTAESIRNEVTKLMTAADKYTSTSAIKELLNPEHWKFYQQPVDVPALALYAKDTTQTDKTPLIDTKAYLIEVFPGLVHYEWDDTGHFLMLEEPERFNTQVREFLQNIKK